MTEWQGKEPAPNDGALNFYFCVPQPSDALAEVDQRGHDGEPSFVNARRLLAKGPRAGLIEQR